MRCTSRQSIRGGWSQSGAGLDARLGRFGTTHVLENWRGDLSPDRFVTLDVAAFGNQVGLAYAYGHRGDLLSAVVCGDSVTR